MSFKIIRGSTVKINSTVYINQDLLVAANLAGSSIRAMFKKTFNDSDANALYTKNIGTGVTILSAAGGTVETILAASETNDNSYNMIYFELLVKLADGSYIRSGVEQIEIAPNVAKVLN